MMYLRSLNYNAYIIITSLQNYYYYHYYYIHVYRAEHVFHQYHHHQVLLTMLLYLKQFNSFDYQSDHNVNTILSLYIIIMMIDY